MQENSIGSNNSRTMVLVFAWIVQGVLAVFYGTIGVLKLTQPIPWLAHLIMWPADVPVPLVRFIGAAELAGAVGLVVPALMGLVPVLVSWAAAGLLVTAPRIYRALPAITKLEIDAALVHLQEARRVILHRHSNPQSQGSDDLIANLYVGACWRVQEDS